MGVCNCSMFCCTLLYVHSSIAIILMGKREPIALLNLSSWCLVMVERLFLAVSRGCLQFVIVVFPDHTHLLFGLPSESRLYNAFIYYYCVALKVFMYCTNEIKFKPKTARKTTCVAWLSIMHCKLFLKYPQLGNGYSSGRNRGTTEGYIFHCSPEINWLGPLFLL